MHRYSPGTSLLIAGRGGVALLADAPVDVRTKVADALAGPCDLGGFVDALTSAFGVSMSGLPAFAVALREDSGVRVAVRGVFTADAGARLSGASVSTWVESLVASDVPVTLGEGAGSPDDLWVESGAVRAGAVRVEFGADAVTSVVVPEPTPVATPVAAPQPAVEAFDPPQPPLAAVQEPEPQPEPESSDVPASATTLAPEPEPESEPQVPVSASQPAPADEDDFSLDTSFGSLWGATSARPPAAPPTPEPAPPAPAPVVETPAPVVETPEPQVAPEPAPAPAPAAEPAPAPAPAAAPAPVAETPLEGGMISGIPTSFRSGAAPAPASPSPAPQAPAAAPTPPAPQPQGDHDGATITVAQMRELAPEASAAPQTAETAAPVQVTYGRAVLSTGQDVTLDRTVIVGRRPKATRITGEPPHLIAVPSPQQDISRNHLELRLEGSSVVAVDLNTTNGSLLRRGTADPVRLHPAEPTVIVSGDVLDLGDAVTIAFVEIP